VACVEAWKKRRQRDARVYTGSSGNF
jgi:hypothetical protein